MSRLFDPTGEADRYDLNPYYNPGRCGLEILAVLDVPNMSYEFDTCVVWIDTATSKLFAARDSGCSCPTPFEEYRSTGDLVEVNSWADVEALTHYNGRSSFDSADLFAARRKVESYLGGMALANEAIEEFREKFSVQEALCSPSLLALHPPEVRESALLDRIADLEDSRDTAWGLNEHYLQVIREQGEFIQSLRVALKNFTARENGGRL